MGKVIELTFNVTPEVVNDDYLRLGVNDGDGNLSQLFIRFKDIPTFSFDTEIPSPYSNTTLASNYKTVFEDNYTIVNLSDPSLNGFIATVSGNVVTIDTNNNFFFIQASGGAISGGSVTANIIPDAGTLEISSYTTVAGFECTQVDVNLTITGGTGTYDIYVDNVLDSSAVTSPYALNLPRGASKEIKVIDSGAVEIGIVNSLDTRALVEDDIFVNVFETGTDFTITVNPILISIPISVYTYSLDDITYQTSNTFTGIPAGDATIYVKDALGCVTSKTINFWFSLIYWFEFTDVENILHRVNIYKPDFTQPATEINGRATLTKASTKDTLETIRGGGLNITLEADQNLTFSDFYTENERVFSVEYIRDSITLFNGWLSPEGLFEDFVNNKWLLTLNCTDGLGFLSNLSYVEDETGLQYVGKQSMLEVIVNCLTRTKIVQNIYTSLENIQYEFQSNMTNVLTQAYINADRFVKDDRGDTIMNCDEVLRSILDLFEACITQYKGNWYIYKPNDLHDNQTLDFYAYDNLGTALDPAKITLNTSQLLGSQINDFYPHHVNSNQRLTIDSAIGAYRINYKYGIVKGFFSNINLESSGDPVTIDEWTINSYTDLSFPDDNRGVLIAADNVSLSLVMTSDSFSLGEGNLVGLRVVSLLFFGIDTFSMSYRLKVILTGTSTYYLDNDLSWTLTDTVFKRLVVNFTKTDNFTTAPLPIDGTVKIEVYACESSGGVNARMFMSECNFAPIDSELDDIKGENHTFQVRNKPSTKIKDVKEIFNGDNPSDVYVGTIYKADEITPTDKWNRLNVRKIPILQYSGEERMAMYSKPLRVFSGDVYGYIDYLSVISIDGITDVLFMPIEYSYDAKANITSLKLKQILNDAGGIGYSDLIYDFSLDYGNVVEPTIKG